MNRKVILNRSIWIILLIIIIVFGFWLYYSHSITIKSIKLISPNNYAFQEDINIVLNKPASVFIRYWKEGSPVKYRTTKTNKRNNNTVHLLLLETNTTYKYQVVIDRLVNISSEVFSFDTREQSPWLEREWIKSNRPHDAKAMGDGLVLLCGSKIPGYICMVDKLGNIRWYWQIDDIGVRLATLTPQNTIVAVLRPPIKDVIDDASEKEKEYLRKIKRPMRRGRIGYAGGAAIVEIDLTGKTLWRIDLYNDKEKKRKIIHHDIRMDKNKNIHTLCRASKVLDMSQIGGSGIDTLVGDGIVVMDTTGKVIWEWSAWDVWDVKNDPYIEKFAYDRFHINALNFDRDNNYLLSVAIEDQIWKINSKTGELMWKLGRNGDFKMDTSSYFSFQHAVNINSEGDIMLFDNSLDKKVSRALSFSLDSLTMSAITKINAPLPKHMHSNRMGSAYLLPNGNILQTSSKRGLVLITSESGEVLWELFDNHLIPYRAEYVPVEIWNKYFQQE
ncbi:MAG: arylsulfotransferase family protein [Bacteroidota bacterium]